MTELNHHALLDFLQCGVVAPNHHFFQSEARPVSTPVPGPFPPVVESDDYTTDLYQSLQEAVANIVASNRCKSWAISGGADSRIILSILVKNHREKLKSLRVYTRVHPELGEDKDRDCLIAKQLSNKFGFPLEIEISDGISNNYLKPNSENSGRVISGLWGGELLGGALLEFFPCPLESIDELSHDSPLQTYYRHLKRMNLQSSGLAIRFDLLYQSLCSGFYKSIPWFTPCMAEIISDSPFLYPKFLKTLFQVPTEQIKDYRLYTSILEKHCDEFLFVEINNPMLKNLGASATQRGAEPKALSPILQPRQNLLDPTLEPLAKYLKTLPPMPYSEFLNNILNYLPYSAFVLGKL